MKEQILEAKSYSTWNGLKEIVEMEEVDFNYIKTCWGEDMIEQIDRLKTRLQGDGL
jgi:hypothetical protein